MFENMRENVSVGAPEVHQHAQHTCMLVKKCRVTCIED